MTNTDDLRALPAVDALLRDTAVLDHVGPHVARWIVRREIDAARARARAGDAPGDVREAIERAVENLTTRRVRRVINATGVLLHTNLGRAPLSDEARAAVLDAMGAAAVEFDLPEGRRASRAPVAATLSAALCDAGAALVVNNNAGALLLLLGALARGREVIVSRGELIEIGGDFRLPDVMRASGATLREVGTTNRTHVRDYAEAITDETALILKVHPSNYRVVGFATRPTVGELSELGIPLVYDTGSGLLAPDDALPDEPDARSALAAGADLVCFSGDKLLGGPQAGIIAGRADLVERCRRDPVARAVRADKLTLAALEATLWAHARGEPTSVRAMLETTDVDRRAGAIIEGIESARLDGGESVIGGGAAPGDTIPTTVIRIDADQRLARALREAAPPIVARVERDTVVLDLRTVDPADDEHVRRALRAALG